MSRCVKYTESGEKWTISGVKLTKSYRKWNKNDVKLTGMSGKWTLTVGKCAEI